MQYNVHTLNRTPLCGKMPYFKVVLAKAGKIFNLAVASTKTNR